MLTDAQLSDAALRLARLAGALANVCDHAEHNEPADITEVAWVGRQLRSLGLELAERAGEDASELYAARLDVIERRNVVYHASAFQGASSARAATTWRELQLVQIEHDRVYHSDVVGLAKADQLRHYALHLAKLAGAAASVEAGTVTAGDFVRRRVADSILFGIKLATVVGERLEDGPVSADASSMLRAVSG